MPWNMFITAKAVSFLNFKNLEIPSLLTNLILLLVFCRLQTWCAVHWTRAHLRKQLHAISWFRISSAERLLQLVKHLYPNWVTLVPFLSYLVANTHLRLGSE